MSSDNTTCPAWCSAGGPHAGPDHIGFFGDVPVASYPDDDLHVIVDQDDDTDEPVVTLYADPADAPEIKFTADEARAAGTALLRAADAADGKPLLPAP